MMIKECCVCRKREQEGLWTRNNQTVVRRAVSHVYCPTCFAGFMNTIERHACKRNDEEEYTVVEAGSL